MDYATQRSVSNVLREADEYFQESSPIHQAAERLVKTLDDDNEML